MGVSVTLSFLTALALCTTLVEATPQLENKDDRKEFCSQGLQRMRCVKIRGYKSGNSTYDWSRRLHYRYYESVRLLAYQFTPNARTMLDVGSNSIPFAGTFTWIPDKRMLNPSFPEGFNPGSEVELIQSDFFEFNCSSGFDLVLCNQVLEHVSDASPFMHKLLQCGSTVVVSVPYQWPVGSAVGKHVHDEINLETLIEWAGGVQPEAFTVVREDDTASGRRIAAVFRGMHYKHVPWATYAKRKYNE